MILHPMNNVLEYLERTAARLPDKTAVIDENGACSYARLLAESRRIGSALGVRIPPRSPVPVLMEKGIDTLSTFFGIVYAGCFYILLNPELPEARLRQILAVLQPPCLITDEEHRELAGELLPKASILYFEELRQHPADDSLLQKIRGEMLDLDPLYANFTSGSTGTPKGVVVGHRSVLDFIGCFTELFHIGEEDIIGNQAPFDFDVSVKDIYSAISTGATLIIIPRRLFSLPAELLDFISDKHITTLIWAVSALCLISTLHGLDYKTPASVNKVLFSGEVMPQKQLMAWMSHLPGAMFVNLYGPTEITCNCTYHIIDRARRYEDGIPIGRAFPNEQVFLLGEDGCEALYPEVGEICVRGTALSLGYYNNPAQTAKSFVPNPLNPRFLEWVYRTGDLGRYDEKGELYFAGRRDFQVKHMGHRIELEEIERAMAALPQVERACCLFDSDKDKLYGFYVGPADRAELHRQLRETLPLYMVPGKLRSLSQFPLTKNGKIDRKALMTRLGGAK